MGTKIKQMKATNKKTLAQNFGISVTTMAKWLKQVPELNLTKGQRVLSPKQISILFQYFGNPYEE